MPKAKVMSPADQHVGARIRMARLMVDMSQEKLGDHLGLTFQQVQKYEKGTNRIAPSRLMVIASVTRVPVTFFFEGLNGAGRDGALPLMTTDDILASPDGLRLASAFMRIKSRKLKRNIVKLVEDLGEDE